MKIELNISDDYVQKLKRQALGAGFLRKAKRQGKPWKPAEEEEAVRFAVNFLIGCVCSTTATPTGADGYSKPNTTDGYAKP